MIGRAGRPQYKEMNGNTGYAYVVANKEEDIDRIENSYFKKNLEVAESSFGDESGLKTMMELIDSGKNKIEDLIGFFEASFFKFQTKVDVNWITERNLIWLIDNGFINKEVDGKYYLTQNLGKVTLNFLQKSFNDYELRIFKDVENYVKEEGLEPDFKLVYSIAKIFNITIYKKGRITDNKIIKCFSENFNIPVNEIGKEEIASYVIYYAWMENKTLKEIETEFQVFPDSIKYIASDIYNSLELVEEMYKANNKKPSKMFQNLKIRVKKGVREKEVSIAIEKGYGREMTKDLYKAALEMITREKGALIAIKELPYPTLLEFYKKEYKEIGYEKLKQKLIGFTKYFRKKRIRNFLELIDREIKNKKLIVKYRNTRF